MIAWLDDWLSGLALRERALLASAFGLGLFALLVFGIALPLSETRQAAAMRRAEQTELAGWMKARAAEAAALEASGGRGTAPARETAPLAAVEASLRAAGLRHAALSPASAGGFEAAFDAVPYGPLRDWLSTLDEALGHALIEAEIEATDAPGTVSARVRTEPAGE
jgi:type II secretory pathway component PulM